MKEHGLDDANGARTPISDDCNEAYDQGTKMLPPTNTAGLPSVKTFQSLVGSLLWIARCTRPDISFAVHRTTRKTHKPTLKDWKMAKRIARYLKESKALRLCINSKSNAGPIKIEIWSGADFAADKTDRKSVSGSVLTMNGAVVAWFCKKKTGVSLITMEAE